MNTPQARSFAREAAELLEPLITREGTGESGMLAFLRNRVEELLVLRAERERRAKIFIAVIPHDYTRATAQAFRTKKEAEQWLSDETDGTLFGTYYCTTYETEL